MAEPANTPVPASTPRSASPVPGYSSPGLPAPNNLSTGLQDCMVLEKRIYEKKNLSLDGLGGKGVGIILSLFCLKMIILINFGQKIDKLFASA